MDTALWATQGLLALVFLGSAALKGTWSRARLVQSGQTGVQNLSLPTIRFIAGTELLGAVGLIAPWASGIAPWLTPLAALGLAIIMILAGIVHARLREPRNVATNVVLFAACVLVALGRS